MKLRRARIELSYDEMDLICSHHPDDLEPTLVEIGGKEYLGQISVSRSKNTYTIKIIIQE